MTLPSFFAASISAGVTASAGGAAARIGSAKSAVAVSAVPALSTSRRLNVFFIASSFIVFPRHSGAPRSGEPGIHTPQQGLWFRARAFGAPRNDVERSCAPSNPENLAVAGPDIGRALFDAGCIVLHHLDILEQLAARMLLHARMDRAQRADVDDKLLAFRHEHVAVQEPRRVR